MTNEQTKKLLDEYKKDPISFRLKYGATAEAELLETAHKKGMTKEVKKQTAKHGGKMKKKYKSGETVGGRGGRTLSDRDGGKALSDRDKEMAMAYALAKAENEGTGGKTISDQDLQQALDRIRASKSRKQQPNIDNTAGRPKMQMGGIADMSAAPMVKPRKKKTQSGFRSKYSKGGGVRPANYKI